MKINKERGEIKEEKLVGTEPLPKNEQATSAKRPVVKVSDAHDPTTTVAGIQANKRPKFGKEKFGQ